VSVYVDVSAAVHRRAGLGRYAESLVRALVAEDPGRYSLFHNRERGYEPLRGLEHVPTRCLPLGYKPWRLVVWMGHLVRAGFDRLVPGADLFHATEHLLMPLRGVPTVLTVHDLIFHLYPKHHKRLNYHYLKATMPIYCRRASAIITISESSKRDIVRCYGVPEEKITVVHEAAAPNFRPAPPRDIAAVRHRYGLPESYVLHVGTIEPRKNLIRLSSAIRILRQDLPHLSLVVVGSKGWLYEGFFRHLEELSPGTVILVGHVPDEDLPALYSGATLCAVPSLYEGFGLPILEAMACRTPVVCSDSSSLPEVGGQAAAYFEPTDTEEMAAVMRDVLADSERRDQMTRLGAIQAERFSWKRAAAETNAVYDQTLQAL
jgi:glycosyltransferase involved in cell wall biosynthesis